MSYKKVEVKQKCGRKRGSIPWNKGAKGKQVGWNKGMRGIPTGKKGERPSMRGSNHWNWKGGTSRTERHLLMNRVEYKCWRISVFERDNWTCQFCGIRGVYLNAHHIKSWANYPALRYEVDNGVSLCEDCHKLTDNYGFKGRKKTDNIQISK